MTSNDWERAESNEHELWDDQSEEARQLAKHGLAIQDSDPESAFRTYLEAAEAGSVWAMESVGWHYDTGSVVAADFGQARAYYDRAIAAGSWMATLKCARLLAEHDHFDDSEAMLEDGVQNDFTPSCFWLAWIRYNRSQTIEACRQIRPLLEHAADRGHPEANLMFTRLMVRGKFGIRNIPRGIGRVLKMAGNAWSQPTADDALRQLATHS